MINLQEIEACRAFLAEALNKLSKEIGPIQIGNSIQFPYGWRKAAKGRTVWRILEETITQNLESKHKHYGFSSFAASDSEVSVYDARCAINGKDADIYINIKSAVHGGRTNKDDISKAIGLLDFFKEDISRQLFICTFVIQFCENMILNLKDCYVMPVSWLPDIYVNPSNNGNLQSSKYKDLSLATKRTNTEFLTELISEIEVARQKREAKRRKST